MTELLSRLEQCGAGDWRTELEAICREKQRLRQQDRKCQRYQELLDSLPELSAAFLKLDADRVEIGAAREISARDQERIDLGLYGLRPWRKGPFQLFGTAVDTEWLSSLKWNRLKDHIAPLAQRKVLDVGSSNGYYLFRMAADRPSLLLGLEPYATFYYQFQLLQHFARLPDCYTLPLKLESLPVMRGFFDTIFHMGVLYHVRSPLDTLIRLRHSLRRGGELVLETLIIPGDEAVAMTPLDRYAKMNNVFFLPTVKGLERWLERSGFCRIRCLDVTRTTLEEQRKTPWIQTESLEDFLDPADQDKTVEGYPAPRRALMLAEAK
ncbi:MAG: tRNA 5-methoxyuridine(34)/uridine 5-oxyacetic acid(34) synthase CmoB [Desulfuromonadaceae bacterium]|nr:tRNA 5-methoxyuridine(34)/uridine 5-oxyacetic acid(34) synthase CmoB [Desulfuromonadaceae bacterium]